MLPIKYSFKFLKRKEAKQIRADFLSNKKRYIRHLVIREIEDTEAVEIFNQPEIIFNEAVPVKEGYRKRAFLKLAGVVGLGAAASLFIPKKAEALIFGSHPGGVSSSSGNSTSVVGIKDAGGTQINPATEETLSGIKSQTDLLTFDSGTNPANLKVNIAAGTIGLKNTGGTAINPATEDTLALIQAQTSKLAFDGSNNLLTSVGGTGNIVGVKDNTNTQINPATDESLVYLRRMVKLMESQATTDAANRQKIIVDGFGAVVTTPGVSGAGVPRVTVASDSAFSASITSLNGYGDQMFQDVARNAFANGIRYNLTFN